MVVGEAEGGSHTTKLENYFVVPLALRMPIYSNFQINGASGETFKVFEAIFTIIKVVRFKF